MKRLYAIATLLGFVLLLTGRSFVRDVSWFQQALYQPALFALGILLALLTVAAFLLWARQSGGPDHNAFVVATLIAGGLSVCTYWLFPVLGFYGGTAFQAPLLMQVVFFGLLQTGGIAVLLLLYRWLAARRSFLALLLYGLLMLSLIPATIAGDQWYVSLGKYSFGHGFTIGWDVVQALLIFGLPLLIHEGLRRRERAPTVPLTSTGPQC